MKNLLLLIIIALGLRLIVLHTTDTIMENDSLEYYTNSIDLSTTDNVWGYSNWYERTPVYTLILHITRQSLFLQVLFSTLTVFLLYKINKPIGWIYALYPSGIFMSSQYLKETYLIFFIVLSIFIFKDNRKYLILAFPLIMLGFVSYGITQPDIKFMQNVWEMWKPSSYPEGFLNYLQMPFYIALVFFFVRKVDLLSPELFIIISFTLIFGFLHGEIRYREPLIPLMLLTLFPVQLNKTKYIPRMYKSENFEKNFNRKRL